MEYFMYVKEYGIYYKFFTFPNNLSVYNNKIILLVNLGSVNMCVGGCSVQYSKWG